MSLQQILRLDGHIQNIYLAVYADKLLLLDGCCRADVPLILDTIRHTLGRPISQLKAVVVTHMHADHAGGAGFLKQHTGCQIISADKTKQWYAGVGGRFMHTVDTSLAYVVAHKMHKPVRNLWYPAHLYPDICVRDGDALPMFADWQVIETAGHTDRDLSLYHQPSKKIYTADLIIKLRHKFVAPFPIYSPSRYQNSLKTVRNLQPSLVMMAHGGIMHIDDATFAQLIAQAPKHRRTVKDTIKHKLLWWSSPHDELAE